MPDRILPQITPQTPTQQAKEPFQAADIATMDRQTQSRWLTSGTLLILLFLPLNSLADKNMVLIVSKESRNQSVVTSMADTPQKGKITLVKKEKPPRLAATLKATTKPHVDTLKQKNEAFEFITFKNVLFAHNGTALNNDAKQTLNDIAAYLHENDRAKRLLISGFSDNVVRSRGDAKISAKRAFVVHEYLRHIGVSPSLMHTINLGEGAPTDEHWTHNGRKRNRRVELYLVQK